MISFIACTFSAYIFWLYFRPVEITSVHQEENYSSVLAKNFPITHKGQINWWQSNKDMLKIAMAFLNLHHMVGLL